MKISSSSLLNIIDGKNKFQFSGGSYSKTHAVLSNGIQTVEKQCYAYNHRDKDIRLIKEMEYIESLSGEAKKIFPAVLKNSKKNNQIVYTLEYIPYPNFSEVIQSGEYSSAQLSDMLANVYDRLFDVFYIDSFNTQNALDELDYISLTKSRLKETVSQLPINHFLKDFVSADYIVLDGITYPGVSDTLERARSYLSRKKIPATKNHGDIIFQNILIDPSSNDFRLVDPNGDSVGFLYDISKSFLCLETKYDMLYQSEFSLALNTEGNIPEAKLKFFDNEHAGTLDSLNKSFWEYLERNDDRFFKNIDEWKRLILLICGLQNLAIIMFHSLHHKKYNRACAFLLSGVRSINNALES